MSDDDGPRPPEDPASGSACQGEGPQVPGGKLAELVAALDPGGDVATLRERLAGFEAEHRRVCAELVELQERHAELVALCVAAQRLHEIRDREQAAAVVEELVVNLVGSEQYAVFAQDGDGKLAPVAGMGVDWRALPAITPGQGALGRAAAEHRIVLTAGAAGGPSDPLAFIPFLTDGAAVGALAVYGLLPQKPALTDFDRRIFFVLQLHAGLALRPCAARG